eukprot:5834491-Amphidinium_carterae.1
MTTRQGKNCSKGKQVHVENIEQTNVLQSSPLSLVIGKGDERKNQKLLPKRIKPLTLDGVLTRSQAMPFALSTSSPLRRSSSC